MVSHTDFVSTIRLSLQEEALQVLDISTTQLEPSQINGDKLYSLMNTWLARWPSSLHPDSLATLAVISVREILLGLMLPLAQKQGVLNSLPALQLPGQSPWQVIPA